MLLVDVGDGVFQQTLLDLHKAHTQSHAWWNPMHKHTAAVLALLWQNRSVAKHVPTAGVPYKYETTQRCPGAKAASR